MLARQAIAQSTDSFRMATPVTISEQNNNETDSKTDTFSKAKESGESADQTYRSERSGSIPSHTKAGKTITDVGAARPSVQQSSSVGSFTVTHDLETAGGFQHLQYSGNIELVSGPRWEATSLQRFLRRQKTSERLFENR